MCVCTDDYIRDSCGLFLILIFEKANQMDLEFALLVCVDMRHLIRKAYQTKSNSFIKKKNQVKYLVYLGQESHIYTFLSFSFGVVKYTFQSDGFGICFISLC